MAAMAEIRVKSPKQYDFLKEKTKYQKQIKRLNGTTKHHQHLLHQLHHPNPPHYPNHKHRWKLLVQKIAPSQVPPKAHDLLEYFAGMPTCYTCIGLRRLCNIEFVNGRGSIPEYRQKLVTLHWRFSETRTTLTFQNQRPDRMILFKFVIHPLINNRTSHIMSCHD